MSTAGNSLALKTEDASRQKKDQRLKFFAFGALWTLLLAGFAVLIIVVMFWWQAWSSSTRLWADFPHSVDTQQKVLESTLAAYKTQVDDLQRLVSLLTGLASFYTLALGITSYFTAQHIIDRSKESAHDIDDYRTEAKKIYDGLEKQYPFFINFSAHIDKGLDRLIFLLPNEEERDEFWEKLKEMEKQEILFLELSMAFVQHLDLSDKRIAVLYRRLGKFYSAWYAVAKEDQRPAQCAGIQFHALVDIVGVIGLKEHVKVLLLGKKPGDAGHDFLAVHLQRRSGQARAQALPLGLHLRRFFHRHQLARQKHRTERELSRIERRQNERLLERADFSGLVLPGDKFHAVISGRKQHAAFVHQIGLAHLFVALVIEPHMHGIAQLGRLLPRGHRAHFHRKIECGLAPVVLLGPIERARR